MRRVLPVVLATATLAISLSSCAGGGAASSSTRQLTVFAASSLTTTFGELEKAFEGDHPDVDVIVSYDSSSSLAEQVTQGAPADVLATADEKSMQILTVAGENATEPRAFASNTMTIVTPPDNPAGIEGLADLVDTDLVLCDPSVPCGALAQQILDNAGSKAAPVSLEDKVTSVLSRVQLGEAEAGLVYVTDAQAAGDEVRAIAIPDDVNEVTPYLIAAVKDSSNGDLAAEWIALVSSQAGQGVLADAGFGSP